MMTIALDILYNLGILVAMTVFSSFMNCVIKNKNHRTILQGFLFGFGSLIGMIHPLVLGPGLIFDGRSVLISLSGIYYGPVSVLISSSMAAAMRIYQGGIGAKTGVLVIFASALIGTWFFFLRQRKEAEIRIRTLLVLGGLTHAAMLLLMFTLPGGIAISTLKSIGLPVFLFYPMATLLIGLGINKEISRKTTLNALSIREKQVRNISNNLKESMIYQFLTSPHIKKFTYLSESVKNLYGITPEQGLNNYRLLSEKILQEDRNEFFLITRKASLNQQTFKAEVRIQNPDGSIRWSSFSATPNPQSDGSILWDGVETVITEFKENQEMLKKSQTTLRNVLDTIPQAVFWKSISGHYLGCNQIFAKDAGLLTPEEVMGKTDFELPWPNQEAEAYRKDDQQVIVSKNPKLHIIEPLQKSDGSRIWIETSKVPLLDEKEAVFSVLGIYQDVTQQKTDQEKIQTALAEKEILLRELYHRTKNNMQVIISLLQLKVSFSKNPALKEIVEEIILRIQAMSLVQQKLTREKNLSRINLKEYFEELVSLIGKNYIDESKAIQFNLNLENIETLIDIATPCGLILNELITNSLKHAFKKSSQGAIEIRVFRNPNQEIEIHYSDNGSGVQDLAALRESNTLGLLTIFSLAEHQLKGTLSYENRQGFHFQLCFSDQRYEERI